MKKHLVAFAVIVLVNVTQAHSQHWSLGGNVGLSLLGGSAGFHVTPMSEFLFNRNMGIGTEFSINTQYGTPLIWYPYFKYYFGIRNSRLKPYANAGPVLTVNVSSSPSFGILFGGGVNIPIANRLYLAPDVIFGPMFGVGGGRYPLVLYGNYYGTGAYGLTSYSVSGATVFAFSIRAGIRYEI